MDRTPAQPATPPRRKRRRWLLLALILLICGGITAYRVWSGPRLRPVAIRQLPVDRALYYSTFGMGYPALEARIPGKPSGNYCWLTDTCQPLPQTFGYALTGWVGPERTEAVVSEMPHGAGFAFVRVRRNGEKVFAGHSYREVYNAPPGMRPLPNLHAADERYLLCTGSTGQDGLVYDRQQRRAIFRFFWSNGGQQGVLFHHGARFLLVQQGGRAQIFQEGRRIAAFGAWGTQWCWGEDGTVWTANGNQLQVLQWRSGTCRLQALPRQVSFDPQVNHTTGGLSIFAQLDLMQRATLRRIAVAFPSMIVHPVFAASLWRDGEYTACTETRNLWPTPLSRLVDRPGSRLSALRRLPRVARVLTLYHRGKRVGSFMVKIKGTSAITAPVFVGGRAATRSIAMISEHLAFTGNGRYLSWVVETAEGTTVYVFRVR